MAGTHCLMQDWYSEVSEVVGVLHAAEIEPPILDSL